MKDLERDEIYITDHKENVKLFKDLKSSIIYSRTNRELNGVYRDKSYQKFYKDLIERKRINKNNFKKMFEKPKIRLGLQLRSEPFDELAFKSYLKLMALKQKDFEYKIKHPHISNFSTSFKKYLSEKSYKLLTERPKAKRFPEVGKYNPNYESIRIHSFYPTFASVEYDKFKKKYKNQYAHQIPFEEERKKNIINIKKSKTIEATKTNKKKIIKPKLHLNLKMINNESLTKRSRNNDSNASQMMSTSSFGDEKNNHCLKFNLYSSRKPILNKVFYNPTSETNINKSKINTKIKQLIKKRMKGKLSEIKLGSGREENIKVNNNPPIGIYEPNFDYISKKTINVYMNKQIPESPKLLKLKRILHSYNVTAEFQIFSELNKKKS